MSLRSLPRVGRRPHERIETPVRAGGAAHPGKGGRAEDGPAFPKDRVVTKKGALRWDRLSADERSSWSARVAANEAHEQGLPVLASPAQHRAVAAVLAKANATGAAGAPACGRLRPLRAGHP